LPLAKPEIWVDRGATHPDMPPEKTEAPAAISERASCAACARAVYTHGMRDGERPRVVDARARQLEVICAGGAMWDVTSGDGARASGPALRVRAGGGAVEAAFALARRGLRVGLATVIADDTYGRALVRELAACGVDVGGVELARPTSALVFVRGGALQALSPRDEEQPIAVPATWSSQVLLLSGLSPVVSHGAALCKAARSARRAGTVVVVDANARWHLWQGKDPRTVRMVLREADVVWCTAHDLFGLQMDVASMRAALRDSAVLVTSDGAGTVQAMGPFGAVTRSAARGTPGAAPLDEGGAFAAAICSELAQGGAADGALWSRALERGQAAARA